MVDMKKLENKNFNEIKMNKKYFFETKNNQREVMTIN